VYALKALNAWIARRREAKAAYEALYCEDHRSRLPRHGTQPIHHRVQQQRAAGRGVPTITVR
jgi:hypothetical protein